MFNRTPMNVLCDKNRTTGQNSAMLNCMPLELRCIDANIDQYHDNHISYLLARNDNYFEANIDVDVDF